MDTFIEKIQSKYFELVDDYFGSLYRRCSDKNVHDAAVHYSNMPLSGNIIYDMLPELKDAIMALWTTNRKELYDSISKIPGLKVCYSGDISPSESFQFISRTGMYVDTTLIPDPLVKLLNTPSNLFEPRYQIYYTVKHVFNVLDAQEFFFSDTEMPISIIYPLAFYFNENRRDVCSNEADEDFKKYFSELFESEAEEKLLSDILSKNTKKIADSIKNPSILPPQFFDPQDVTKGLENGNEVMSSIGIAKVVKKSGLALKLYVIGRLMGLSDCFLDCVSFDSKPVFDSVNSWSMFKWKLASNNYQITKKLELDPSTAIINSLQLDNFRWLGNIPPEKLVTLRNNNELSEIRELLAHEISEIHNCNRADLELVANRVKYNLKSAFEKHKEEIKTLEEDLKTRYQIDGTLLVTGAICAVASLFWSPAALISIIGGGGILGFYDAIAGKKEKIEEITNKPIGILFSASQEGTKL